MSNKLEPYCINIPSLHRKELVRVVMEKDFLCANR